MKLCIVIPAYNEEKVIAKTIDSLPSKISPFKKVIIVVIDDGSHDQTYKIAKSKKVTVLRHIINRGLGAALKTGFEYAKKQNADIVVTFDADGQHHAAEIKKVVKPIIQGSADIVIGSRFISKHNVAIIRKFIILSSNLVTFFMFGIWTTDSQSGFRAISKNALRNLDVKGQRMEIASEFFKEIKAKKLRFKEVSVKAIYTEYSIAKGQQLSNSMNVFGKITLLLFR